MLGPQNAFRYCQAFWVGGVGQNCLWSRTTIFYMSSFIIFFPSHINLAELRVSGELLVSIQVPLSNIERLHFSHWDFWLFCLVFQLVVNVFFSVSLIKDMVLLLFVSMPKEKKKPENKHSRKMEQSLLSTIVWGSAEKSHPSHHCSPKVWQQLSGKPWFWFEAGNSEISWSRRT